MAKLTVGDKLYNFTYNTPYETELSIYNTIKNASGKTAILFLRYYGCPLCQYDMHLFAKGKEEIQATGGQLLIVLQSDPQNLAKQLPKGEYPFDIICDPQQELYKFFEIAPGETMAKMINAKTMAKVAKATAKGFKHGEYEGNEQQLPALFITDNQCNVCYVNYYKTLGDVASPKELAELLKH